MLLEGGLLVREGAGGVVVAAPVGRVVRRVEEDFWMWGEPDGVLVAVTETAFCEVGAGRVEFLPGVVQQEVGGLAFLEAQVCMFCAGEDVRYADVVRYGVRGGLGVWRVRRDDGFLRTVLEGVDEFRERFLGKGARPPREGFELKVTAEVVDGVLEGCAAAECRYIVDGEVCEQWLDEWRALSSDWERKISEKPFY